MADERVIRGLAPGGIVLAFDPAPENAGLLALRRVKRLYRSKLKFFNARGLPDKPITDLRIHYQFKLGKLQKCLVKFPTERDIVNLIENYNKYIIVHLV